MSQEKNESPISRVIQALTAVRDEENRSWSYIANELGIDPSSLAHIRSGRTKTPSKMLVSALREKFGINPDWIWTGEGDIAASARPASEAMARYALSSPEERRRIAKDPKALTELLIAHWLELDDLRAEVCRLRRVALSPAPAGSVDVAAAFAAAWAQLEERDRAFLQRTAEDLLARRRGEGVQGKEDDSPATGESTDAGDRAPRRRGGKRQAG